MGKCIKEKKIVPGPSLVSILPPPSKDAPGGAIQLPKAWPISIHWG